VINYIMRPCHKIYLSAKKFNLFVCELLIFGVPFLNVNLALGLGLVLALALVLELFSCWL